MDATVLKFGGSTFVHPAEYDRVARHIAGRLVTEKRKIVAVVSAMSGATDKLKAVMLDVNKQPSPSNLDAALATGEMLSACLLEAAVGRLGVLVTSLNGYSLGIRTNSDFGSASIKSADPQPICAALLENDVVIAAGAQAIDQAGRLTFLGRNSSDLTAVVIASMLEQHACEIYSDVPGVYTADPYLVSGAQLIPEIGHRRVAEMSRHGAKVLHYRAVDYAEKQAVTIICKSLTSEGAVVGTTVKGHAKVPSVTIARDATVLSCSNFAERDNLRDVLDQHDIAAISIEDSCGAAICIVSDIDSAMRLGPLKGARVSIKRSTAVTELGTSVCTHLESDHERAVSLARRIHDRMYPGAAGKPLEARMAKQRSSDRSPFIRRNDGPRNSS